MKILFVCTTEFQLLTALNLKYNVYKEDVADIVVDNYHGEEAALAERIRETALFRHVCFVKSDIEQKTMHAYLRGISDGKLRVSFGNALKNSGYFVVSRIKTALAGARGWLESLVNDFHLLPLAEYDFFYGYGSKTITTCMRSCLHEINPACQIVQLDEGVGSYYLPNVGQNSEIDFCEVYEPKLIQFNATARQIPAIRKDDIAFLNIVNKVFEYDSKRTIDFRDCIIFFDQGVSSPMPKYLRNASSFTKMIFHNSYKRHKEEEKIYNKWKQLTLETLKAVGGKKIWIKPHPRSAEGALSIFTDMPNVEILPQHQAPWEIMALNSEVDNSVLMTFFSSSSCLHYSAIEPAGNNTSILLYNFVDLEINRDLISYYNALGSFFQNNFFIPKDKAEFLAFWKK